MTSKNETIHEFPLSSLLSARQILEPQITGNRIYFIANFSGAYSLYYMEKEGTIPVPILPTNIALQNPHLINGENYHVFPDDNLIVVMIDQDGNELYQPHVIPLEGGIPKPLFSGKFDGMQVMLSWALPDKGLVFFNVDDRKSPGAELFMYDIRKDELSSIGKTPYGLYVVGVNEEGNKAILAEGYGPGDTVLFYWEKEKDNFQLFYGIPLNERKNGSEIKLENLGHSVFVNEDRAIITQSIINHDNGAITYFDLDLRKPIDVEILGLSHEGSGELESFIHVKNNLFLLSYNIDGCTIGYEARFILEDETPKMIVERELIGFTQPLMNGLALGVSFDEKTINTSKEAVREYLLVFTKATMPTQLFLMRSSLNGITLRQYSRERALGIPQEYLSEGEDASYTSFDGLRISARLYLPSEKLNYSPPYPLVVYIHGGPQGQERPDFSWFSMPLIQYLTLNGFAVFVPNVRGSTGYGFEYMNKVTRDWGGNDLKDHIEGLKILERDHRIDSRNRFVVGRSYGGYMTLSLVSRVPDAWNAGCDMFGPYDLIGFYNRLPPSWQVYFQRSLGDPEKDREFLIERSPKTYFNDIKAPLLVIQGKNDPRVTLEESKEIFEQLKNMGKDVELMVLEDEGHDVIKLHNRVKVYTRITEFFKEHIKRN